jgi:hypothetical protein
MAFRSVSCLLYITGLQWETMECNAICNYILVGLQLQKGIDEICNGRNYPFILKEKQEIDSAKPIWRQHIVSKRPLQIWWFTQLNPSLMYVQYYQISGTISRQSPTKQSLWTTRAARTWLSERAPSALIELNEVRSTTYPKGTEGIGARGVIFCGTAAAWAFLDLHWTTS